MNKGAANAAIVRACELSREMIVVAERGDMQGVLEIDTRRSRFLHEFLDHAHQLSDAERERLSEISQINETVIRKLEFMRKATARSLDTVSRGKRALAAYSRVQGGDT